MNKRLILLMIVGLSFAFFTACNSDRTDQVAKIAEVMKIHDEVMPKMDQIVDLQSRVESLISELQSDSVNIDKRRLESAKNILKDLNEADASMWDWMNGFKLPDENDPRPHNEIMAYLEAEKKSIQKVSDLMLSSIESGKELLENNE